MIKTPGLCRHKPGALRKTTELLRLMKFRLNQSERTVFSLIYYIDLFCLRIGEYEKLVSQKLHLDAGIFRIHWFDTELLRAHDADFVIFGGILFRINELFPDASGRCG